MNIDLTDLYKTYTYDPINGKMVKLSASGCIASDDGYRKIRVNQRFIREHRLIWFIETGEWPEGNIDHIDGNRQNNKISNLRIATSAQNKANTPPKNALSGNLYIKHLNKYRAIIGVGNRKKKHIGYFNTPEEATAAYIAAHKALHGEYSYFNRPD